MLLSCVVMSACATSPDPVRDDPDAAYVIESTLVPYCGRGGCHSTNTAASNLIFDTVDGALAAMSGSKRGQKLVVASSPNSSKLYTILTDTRKIMPPDVPLPDADKELIRVWIANGARGLP